ncbi:MAG: D-alanyl-D-alanine carboxypeptidase [Eubacteriales bacterium]|nr:D-alanyl-D-alanine carboxypeptidase [Eubacteriales bacterium]
MKKRLKVHISIISIFIIFFTFIPQASFAEAKFESAAKSAILLEASTGYVIFEKDADIVMPPASITKLMTLLLAFEAVESGAANWDDDVKVSEKAWAYNVEGSLMYLEVGKSAPYEEIVKGISIVSANDGCIAIAEHISGSEENFVKLMNKRAAELGLTKTNFKNVHGLPEKGHVMSARDIGNLAQYLITTYPEILDIESMTEYTYNGIKQYNRNPLLADYPGADGLKTGWTNEAGYCLTGTAKRGGMRLVSVVLNTVDEAQRFDASKKLLDYGFNNYELETVVKVGTYVTKADVSKGKELTVDLNAARDVTVVIPTKRKADIKVLPYSVEGSLSAPVEEGTVCGTAEIKLDDEVLAEFDLKTAKKVEKAGFFERIFRAIKEFFKNLFN